MNTEKTYQDIYSRKNQENLEMEVNLVAVTIVLIALNAKDKSWKQTNDLWLVSALKLKGILVVYTFSRIKQTTF